MMTLFQEERRRVDITAVTELAHRYGSSGEGSLDDVVQELLGIRERARWDRDYKTADAIRDALQELGFEIQDTDDGAKWRLTL